jgi:hypothetical protein
VNTTLIEHGIQIMEIYNYQRLSEEQFNQAKKKSVFTYPSPTTWNSLFIVNTTPRIVGYTIFLSNTKVGNNSFFIVL